MVVGCARPRHAATERAAATAAGAAALVSEEAEELLQLLFSVQGTFTDAQAAAVAAQEGCSAETALTFFQGLQTAAARCLQRARERASEAAAAAAAAADGSGGINGSRTNGSGVNGGGSAGTAAVGLAAAAAARQAGGSKLKRLINDPGDGGLRDASVTGKRHRSAETVLFHPQSMRCLLPSHATAALQLKAQSYPVVSPTHPPTPTGPFVSLMTSLSSSVVRCRAAAAVAASRRNIRGKLVTTGAWWGLDVVLLLMIRRFTFWMMLASCLGWQDCLMMACRAGLTHSCPATPLHPLDTQPASLRHSRSGWKLPSRRYSTPC